jgi:hypothetical protein
VAFKVADGAPRAVHLVALEVLRQLGALADADFAALEAEFNFGPHQTIRNFRGLVTGEARAVFALDYSGG